MQAIDVTETVIGVQVTHRVLPQLLRVAFFSGALAFATFVLWNVDLSQGSWLPPLDRMPDWAKQALIYLATGAGLAIIVYPIVRGAKVLIFGEVWEFDALRQRVTRNGEVVALATDIDHPRLTGDFRGDTSDITLHIVRRNGRKVEIAEGSLDQAEFERFLDLSRRIRARLKVPIEIASLPSSGSGIPSWWNTRV